MSGCYKKIHEGLGPETTIHRVHNLQLIESIHQPASRSMRLYAFDLTAPITCPADLALCGWLILLHMHVYMYVCIYSESDLTLCHEIRLICTIMQVSTKKLG